MHVLIMRERLLESSHLPLDLIRALGDSGLQLMYWIARELVEWPSSFFVLEACDAWERSVTCFSLLVQNQASVKSCVQLVDWRTCRPPSLLLAGLQQLEPF